MSEREVDFSGVEQRHDKPPFTLYFVGLIESRDNDTDLYYALRDLGIDWKNSPYTNSGAEVIRVHEHQLQEAKEILTRYGFWTFLESGPDGARVPVED